MRKVKISRWLTNAAVCILVLASGCAPAGKEAGVPEVKPEKAGAKKAADIALKFSTGDSATYRIISESERGIKWEGAVPEESTFESGRNYSKLDMTFAQEIKHVDDNGNAIAKITVKELKYSTEIKDNPTFDFDSSKPQTDPNNQMAKLIGQSYTIKIAPTGAFIEVIEAKEIETSVRKATEPPRIALRLLASKAIGDRHGTLILPDAGENQLRIGGSWSKKKDFSFGMMGSESYEQIYTLNKIENQNGRQIAFIKMNAIPSSETSKEQASDVFKSTDTTKTYDGELEFDSTTGKVRKYLEKLQAEWVIAFPSTEKDAKEPAVLTMSDTRFYSIEKID